ncbi:hypothetical protein QMW84_08865 [Cronobacter sakazakii]|jgi:hypothetical protein|uniref:Uncharacterized protein n=1 Tax=Syntrophobacter fumaroxidans (strain DSM 10017 / MPOB) TaxID=335543 RepID=A0LPU7_SYNFM|nr:hypothetical protein [Syntrophobacter fumaroxidans]MDI7572485.1 hypothetical protein [Cronobacter sakazakii]ABK19449.1 conserved hypothetical protein [Syntrophobacter fumaroxidans MPOB]MDI7653844.1 hypothetical protein [Cronobacter sakazakii]MDK1043516.1 hypothetical protein [Cronobacter sakazakii]MDK1048834.1 hypothetical protein [Cronobacter sakazakii]
MATFNLRRFSKPEMLRRIDRKHLIAFLEPHAAYFSARGVELPPVQQEDGLDYNALSHLLLTPDSTTPDDLAEALFYVNEVSTPEGFDSIQDEIAGTDIDVEIGENAAPADLAIQVWMADREIIEKVHAEQFFMNVRSFEYFKTKKNPLPDFVLPSEETLAALEADLDEWFSKKRRGKYSKVFVYPKEGHTWFLVRHGKPYAREAVIEAGESTSQYFRPEKFDVLAYNPVIGEIRMNAETKGEKELYRKKFGFHLFGDEEFFNERSRFDLEPLRQIGEDALLCDDVDGIEYVRLKEVQVFWGGAHKDVEIRRSEDIFASLRDRGVSLPGGGKIIKASFQIKFEGSKTPRSVILSSGNRAQFKRDGDAEIIERWLGLRGFIVGAGGVSDE